MSDLKKKKLKLKKKRNFLDMFGLVLSTPPPSQWASSTSELLQE
jgi:hypothetical protein